MVAHAREIEAKEAKDLEKGARGTNAMEGTDLKTEQRSERRERKN
jgi:hypothetical protein